MQSFDVVVLGAGAMGSAAAYHIAKAGRRVLLVEQFEIDHQKGSSYGHSRIIRYAYAHPAYIRLARSTYHLWFELQDEAGEQLYIPTGGIDFGRSGEPSLISTIDSLKMMNIPFDLLSPGEAEEQFPQFRFDDDMVILYQAHSGILAPSRCVRVHVRLARQHGAVIRDHTPVSEVKIHPNDVEVEAGGERYRAEKLVITAGSWAGRLLESTGLHLPLQPLRCQEAYFAPVDADSSAYASDQMPVFIYHQGFDRGEGIYGLPGVGGSGVKVGIHGGQSVSHPSEVDYTPDETVIERVRAFSRRHIPAIGDGPLVSARICLYTMTPDEHFIVDRHPAHAHVVIGAGFSGHGFKFSAGIGKILADLALEGATSHDIDLFQINRFESPLRI